MFEDTVLLVKVLEIVILIIAIAIIDRKLMKPMLARKLSRLNSHTFVLVSAVFSIFFFVLALIVILILFDVYSIAYAILTSLGVAGIIIGLAAKDIFGDLFSGLLLFSERSISVGDLVEFEGKQGHIHDMTLRVTRIETLDGELITIPNSLVRAKIIINKTVTGNSIRASMSVELDYDSDTGKALDICNAIMRGNPDVLKDPEPSAFLSEFGDSGIRLVMRFWVDTAEHSVLKSKSDMIFAIRRAFKHAGIIIPFKQMTISRRSSK